MPEYQVRSWLVRIRDCSCAAQLLLLKRDLEAEQENSVYNARDLRFNSFDRLLWPAVEKRLSEVDDDAFFRSPIVTIQSCERELRSDVPFKSLQEFLVFDETCCSDWREMTPDGDSFGGFYRAREGSVIRESAYEMTRVTNGMLLWYLTFPKSLLLFSTRIGCPSRNECVRYSNFFASGFTENATQEAHFYGKRLRLNESFSTALCTATLVSKSSYKSKEGREKALRNATRVPDRAQTTTSTW